MGLQLERLCDKLQIPQTDFDLSGFDFREIRAINAHSFGQLELSPSFRVAEFANTNPEAHADVGGHPPMVVCSLSPTNRL